VVVEEIVDDGYIHANLARHLLSCGGAAELTSLLLDYRWTSRQLDVNGLLYVKADFGLLLEALSDRDGDCRDRGGA
jgi:hypothetical protein